jgi:dihydroorotate dehydrogenase
VILSNTTLGRSGLRSTAATEAGGLSGRPLLPGTIDAVAGAHGARLAVIGSGGIGSGHDARRVLDAGADLVQLWTGHDLRRAGAHRRGRRPRDLIQRESLPDRAARPWRVRAC